MRTVKGCLIELVNKGEFDIFAHGCNCKHAMGAGIAPKIATAFPVMKQADDMARSHVGGISSAYIKLGNKQKVLGMNWYTQHNPGANFNLAYLACIVEYMRHDIWDTGTLSELDTTRKLRIGIPLIGCGIGGGDPRQAMALFTALEAEEKYEVTLVLWQPPVPPVSKLCAKQGKVIGAGGDVGAWRQSRRALLHA